MLIYLFLDHFKNIFDFLNQNTKFCLFLEIFNPARVRVRCRFLELGPPVPSGFVLCQGGGAILKDYSWQILLTRVIDTC